MADMKWNEINANFNDVNSGVSNAITGYSNVGDIFGKLRQSILDEEQRAWERSHKEKEFAENQYQFDANQEQDWWKHEDKMGLDWANYDENIRQFNENLKQKDRHHADNVAIQRQSLAQQGAELAIRKMEAQYRHNSLKAKDAQDQALAEIIKQETQLAVGQSEQIRKENIEPLERRQRLIKLQLDNPVLLTPDQKTALEKEFEANNKQISQWKTAGLNARSYNALDGNIRRRAAAELGLTNVKTPFTEGAKEERERAMLTTYGIAPNGKPVNTGTHGKQGNTTNTGTGNSSGTVKGLTAVRTLLSNMKLKPEEEAQLLKATNAMHKRYPNISPEKALEAAIIWAGPTRNERMWGDRNILPALSDSDISALELGTPMSPEAQNRLNLVNLAIGNNGGMPDLRTIPLNTRVTSFPQFDPRIMYQKKN